MRRRHNRGFFIIWGSRNRITADGSGSIQAVCPSCQRNARLDGMQVRNWFTLYFIPVFPMGSAQRFTQCSACRSQFRGNLEEMKSLMSQQSPQLQSSYQGAIGLFNSMRETPGDSAKLAQLLQMYLQMGEFKEAVTAGRSFPAALQESDACLAMMGQALLQSGDREGAARHVEAALVLNPQNAQALALRNRALPQRTG